MINLKLTDCLVARIQHEDLRDIKEWKSLHDIVWYFIYCCVKYFEGLNMLTVVCKKYFEVPEIILFHYRHNRYQLN
jgi:hypothetical protein